MDSYKEWEGVFIFIFSYTYLYVLDESLDVVDLVFGDLVSGDFNGGDLFIEDYLLLVVIFYSNIIS